MADAPERDRVYRSRRGDNCGDGGGCDSLIDLTIPTIRRSAYPIIGAVLGIA